MSIKREVTKIEMLKYKDNKSKIRTQNRGLMDRTNLKKSPPPPK